MGEWVASFTSLSPGPVWKVGKELPGGQLEGGREAMSRMGSWDQQRRHHLGSCKKCEFSGPAPDL